MGSRRGLMEDGEANILILLEEARQALSQPCHGKSTESCQAKPDCINMLFKQEQHARARCIIHDRCEWGLRHLVVESGDALEEILPDGEPLLHGGHVSKAASLNTASYTILWSLPTRLYLYPSITSVINPSEPDPTHKSTRPASIMKPLPEGRYRRFQMVWYGMLPFRI